MVRNLVIGHDRLAKARGLDVVTVVRADGHGRIDNVGDDVEDLADSALQLGLLGVQLHAALVILLDGGVIGVDLRLQLGLSGLVGAFFELAVERPVGLRELIARGLQAFDLLLRGALFRVERNDLVYQRQLFILKLFADIFLDGVGIFPDKSDV